MRKPQNDPFKTLEGKDLTRVPMMQVIEEDTHDNYVVCQGYDPDYDKFFYKLSVAKPYGERGQTGIYNVGEVHPAVKPITIIGTTPGVAETTGHPADLDEAVVKLTDENGIDVQWMLIGVGKGNGLVGKLDADLDHDDTTGVTVSIYSDPTTDSDENIEDVLPPPWLTEGKYPSGSWVKAFKWGEHWYAEAIAATSVTVTSNLQVDGANAELEKKTRTINVISTGDESDWTVWHTGDTC